MLFQQVTKFKATLLSTILSLTNKTSGLVRLCLSIVCVIVS